MTDPVSRETADPPAQAAAVFGAQLPLAVQYVAHLASGGIERGVIGPREAPRLWERHVLNCAVVTDLVDMSATVADVGSGAGLPGIPMAIRRPDLVVTLVEPLLRRSRFLDEMVDELGLTNVEVVRARADQLHGERRFAVVTSRAVAPLARLLSWSIPLVAPAGAVLAMKGKAAADEAVSVEDPLVEAGLTPAEVLVVGETQLVFPTTVVRVEVGSDTPLRWPQHSGGRRRRQPHE